MSVAQDRRTSPAGEAGVDDSLIAACRRLTPIERLRQNDRMIQTIVKLRAAFAQRVSRPEAGEQR